MSATERRNLPGTVEFREVGNSLVATGYAAVFDRRSQNLGGFVEYVRPGAFRKTLQEADVRALFNHDPNFLLGRRNAGTLRLEEDEVGLRYEVDLPDTTTGRDVAALLRRGDLYGSSFGFRTIKDDWNLTEDGFPVRHLVDVALLDVGPVTNPAYTDATAAVRSLGLQVADAEALADAVRRKITPPVQEQEEGRAAPTPFRAPRRF